MVDYNSEKLQLMTHDLDIGGAVGESGYQNFYFTVQIIRDRRIPSQDHCT